MRLITSNETLAKYIPNVMASVKGEASLFDKLSIAFDMTESWVIKDFLGQNLFDSVCSMDSNAPVRIYTCQVVVSDAFCTMIPMMDLVLTPNGFGIVNNSNVAPASRERVDKLIEAVEMERDKAIHLLLNVLPFFPEWLNTEQCARFSSTMFHSLDVVDMVGIRYPRWRKFIELSPVITSIEEIMINLFFGQEQMDTFRKEAMSPSSTSSVMKTVIRSIRAAEVQMLKAHLSATALPCSPPTSLIEIVNIIRQHPEVFTEWHSSKIKELFSPKLYENNRKDKGYWF